MEAHTDHKFHMPQRRQFLVLIPFALFYSAAAILGQLEVARTLGMLRTLERFVLWFLGSYLVLLILCTAISQREVIVAHFPFLSDMPRRKRRQGKWYVYVLFAGVCLLSYLPYFLMYYPGWLNNDAVWQIEQILGWAPGSNHHPYYHTLIMKCFFMIGYRLSGTYTGGAAFYTFCQVVIMAMVFAFFLYWLYRRGTRLLWMILAVVFYALLPVNGMLTICMGKDEFFTAALLFFAWMTVALDLDAEPNEKYDKKTNPAALRTCCAERERAMLQRNMCASDTCVLFSRKVCVKAEMRHKYEKSVSEQKWAQVRREKIVNVSKWIAYFMAGLLVCLLRSNGIFIFAGTALFLVLVKLNGRRVPVRTILCVVAVLFSYMICHGPVLRALQVEPPDTIEGLTMPTQHILCAYLKGGTLTEEEIQMIDQAAPVDRVGDYYNPWLFDPVKNYIREEGNQQVIEDHKWEYFKLWLKVGLRNPFQYMVAEVRQTCGYWTYDVKDYEYVYGEYYMVDNPFGITTERKLFSYDQELKMHDFLMGFQDLYNKVWSLGLNTWLMVFGIAYMAYNGRNAMIYVPFLVLLGTLLLATPVYNEFRYAYGVFAAFPMLFGYSFGERKGAQAEIHDEERWKIR